MPSTKLWLFSLAVVAMTCLLGCSGSADPNLDQGAENTTEEKSVAETPQTKTKKTKVTTLKVGDPAPPVQIAEWIKGGPVTSYEPGKIYIVEFWATWCPPCREGMPHLSELQEHFSDDLTIVSITRQDPEKIRTFMASPADESIAQSGDKTWGDLMRYAVGIDDNDACDDNFMDAAGRTSYPTAFIVGKDAHVEWIGHPMDLDLPIEQLVSGSWNRDEYLSMQIELQEKQQRLMEVQQQMTEAVASEDWETAIKLIDANKEDIPNAEIYKLSFLIEAGKTEEALPLIGEIAETHHKDAAVLNSIAWSITDIDTSSEPLLQKALELAERACVLTGFANGELLDTLARIYAKQGNLEEAINWQNRAVEATPDSEKLQETLEEYKSELKGAVQTS